MRGLIDDNRVLISLIACSMNPETAVTFNCDHFKWFLQSMRLLKDKEEDLLHQNSHSPCTINCICGVSKGNWVSMA